MEKQYCNKGHSHPVYEHFRGRIEKTETFSVCARKDKKKFANIKTLLAHNEDQKRTELYNTLKSGFKKIY